MDPNRVRAPILSAVESHHGEATVEVDEPPRASRRIDERPILNEPWPDDLNPATVPFRTRSSTVLKRQGYFDDPSLFNILTEGEVLSWTNAGPITVADIRTVAVRVPGSGRVD